MAEYEGSAFSGAPNSDVADSNGGITLGTIGSALGNAAAAAINAVFGISSASASGYSILDYNGIKVGFIQMPGAPVGLSLAAGLKARGYDMDMMGNIFNIDGQNAGQVGLGAVGTTIGPINIDLNTTVQEVNTPYGPETIATIPADILGSAVAIKGGDGATFTLRQRTRYWKPTISSTNGVSIMDYANYLNLFKSPAKAFMRPRFIGGRDGIYDIQFGRRVVPPQGGFHPNPQGWDLGAASNYAKFNIILGWTAQGRLFFWGATGDYWNVVDPTTGKFPVIVAAFKMKGWNGSQQISPDGYIWDYPTAPTVDDPRYYTSLAGVLAYSNVASNAAFVTYPEGSNPGGPDGGPSH